MTAGFMVIPHVFIAVVAVSINLLGRCTKQGLSPPRILRRPRGAHRSGLDRRSPHVIRHFPWLEAGASTKASVIAPLLPLTTARP